MCERKNLCHVTLNTYCLYDNNNLYIINPILEYFHKNGLYILEKQKDEKGNEALVPTLYRLTDDEFTLLKVENSV